MAWESLLCFPPSLTVKINFAQMNTYIFIKIYLYAQRICCNNISSILKDLADYLKSSIFLEEKPKIFKIHAGKMANNNL